MSRTLTFVCISDTQTHSDKKRAQLIMAEFSETKKILSVQIVYKSNTAENPLFEVKKEYEFQIPFDESPEIEEEITEKETED